MPTPTKRESKPPPNWRLEAIAATERPRSLALAPDGRTLVFIQDRDTSDLWKLVLGELTASASRPGATRCRTGRTRRPRSRRTGRTVAYADQGAIWLVTLEGGPPTEAARGREPGLAGREDASRLRRARRHLPPRRRGRGRPVAPPARAGARRPRPAGRGVGRRSLSGRVLGRIHLPACRRPQPQRDPGRLARERRGTGAERRREHPRPRSDDGLPTGRSSRTRRRAPAGTSSTSSAPTAPAARRLTHDDADFFEQRWHPEGDRLVATRGRHGRYDLVLVDASSGDVTRARARRRLGGAALERRRVDPRDVRGPGDAARAPARHGGVGAHDAARACAARRAHRAARRPGGDRLPVVRRRRGPRVSLPAFERLGGEAGARGRVSARRPDLRVRRRMGRARPVLRGQGLRLARTELPRLDRLRPRLRAAAARPGRRGRHEGLPGRGRLPAHARLGGRDRLAIFGASWGSFISLLAATDDPEHRFRCAVCKYGDSNFLTSWSQGDRGGVHEAQENLAGSPAASREAYERASAVHRLEQVAVPILVAHGEKDERVHPKQSEELVAGLRAARQDVRVRDVPDRGSRAPARRPADRLLPPPRAVPRLVPDVSAVDNRRATQLR